jgi:hypothetical protein
MQRFRRLRPRPPQRGSLDPAFARLIDGWAAIAAQAYWSELQGKSPPIREPQDSKRHPRSCE